MHLKLANSIRLRHARSTVLVKLSEESRGFGYWARNLAPGVLYGASAAFPLAAPVLVPTAHAITAYNVASAGKDMVDNYQKGNYSGENATQNLAQDSIGLAANLIPAAKTVKTVVQGAKSGIQGATNALVGTQTQNAMNVASETIARSGSMGANEVLESTKTKPTNTSATTAPVINNVTNTNTNTNTNTTTPTTTGSVGIPAPSNDPNLPNVPNTIKKTT